MASPEPPRSLQSSPRPAPSSPTTRQPQDLQPVPQPRRSSEQERPPSTHAERQEGQQGTERIEEESEEVEQDDESGTNFSPLFTLVSDVTNPASKSTHHPRVHYIFSDDDPDVLTQALSASDPTASHLTPTPRAVLLDLQPTPDGSWSIAHASSLSADWAVVDASLRRMEDGDTSGSTAAAGVGSGALMLRIEGVEGEAGDLQDLQGLRTSGSGASGARSADRGGDSDYPALIEEFERRMVVMRRVVSAGESRRKKITEQAEQAEQAEDAGNAEGEGKEGD